MKVFLDPNRSLCVNWKYNNTNFCNTNNMQVWIKYVVLYTTILKYI